MALIVSGLSACAPAGQEPGPGLRGYGTPDVSVYMPADQATGLQALLDRCGQVPPPSAPQLETQGLPASCSQLRHTLRNQPGNAAPGPAL